MSYIRRPVRHDEMKSSTSISTCLALHQISRREVDRFEEMDTEREALVADLLHLRREAIAPRSARPVRFGDAWRTRSPTNSAVAPFDYIQRVGDTVDRIVTRRPSSISA